MIGATIKKEFRTGAWYGEQALDLDFPADWDLTVLWPRTPPALTGSEIAACFEKPAGQAPLRELCRGRSRPLIIVDDLNRPTPVSRVMPQVLEQFRLGGIAPQSIRVLLATGTHAGPSAESVSKKIGPEAASLCQVVIHDAKRNCVSLGRTSFGTPVLVDKEVTASDFVMGIGGIYPNHTAGFGGGSKLALGALGFRSIMHLHFGHRSMRWGKFEAGNALRQDLNEIARAMRLQTMISLQINADREVIRIACGDHFAYYDAEVEFCKKHFMAPLPTDADVVISNAYPSDSNFTVMHQKGITPLQFAPPGASRIVIASCTEGAGYHGLTPVLNRPPLYRARQIARRLSMMTARELVQAAALRFRKGSAKPAFRPQPRAHAHQRPIWLYRPAGHSEELPPVLPGFKLAGSWPEVLESVSAEQSGRKRLKAYFYACAPLQCLGNPNCGAAGDTQAGMPVLHRQECLCYEPAPRSTGIPACVSPEPSNEFFGLTKTRNK